MSGDITDKREGTRVVQADGGPNGRRASSTAGLARLDHLYDSVAHLRESGGRDTHHRLFYGRRGTPTQWSLADALTSLEPGRRAPSSIRPASPPSRRVARHPVAGRRAAAGRQRL